MEVMVAPNKETLTFYQQIRPWIVSGTKQDGIMKYHFSDNTPKSVLELFEEIKGKLSYPCSAV